ncbi:MAG: hypothetical protein JO369_01370 [Paucibacter sp.]|nr:hypothetical protein [Roseateles sp.]
MDESISSSEDVAPRSPRRARFNGRQQAFLQRIAPVQAAADDPAADLLQRVPVLPTLPQIPNRPPVRPQGAHPSPPQSPRRPVAMPPRSKFKQSFALDKLATLREDVRRGGGKKLGKFKGVIEAAEQLTGAQAASEVGAAQRLITQIDTYCTDKRVKSYQSEMAKAEGKRDAKTVKKMEKAFEMRREAGRMIEDHVNLEHLGRDSRDPATREKAYEGHAQAMAEQFGFRRAGAGSSVVQLVGNGDRKVAYAFKSIEGESDQTGMSKGSGAVREALASAMSDALKGMTGLDLGFPSVALVDFGGKKGALIEGLSGRAFDRNELGTAVAEGKMTAEQRKQVDVEVADHVKRMPAKELQKVLVCNYAMAQFDIKWDNLMISEGADGTVAARPFDAGAGFLDDKALAKDPRVLDAGPGGPGAMLLDCPIGHHELAQANAPLDPEIVDGIMKIDVGALKQILDAERARLAKAHGLGDDVLDDNGMERAYRSVKIMQEIVGAQPDILTKDFVSQFCDRLPELR